MSTSAMLLHLIERYVELTSRYTSMLREELQQKDLLHAVSSRAIAREGVLRNGAQYRFHGVGCSIEDSTLSIDFDFGPEGRCDGFDAWRLNLFAQQLPEFAPLQDLKSIEKGLMQLSHEGKVSQPRWPPSPHLFYLVAGKCDAVCVSS